MKRARALSFAAVTLVLCVIFFSAEGQAFIGQDTYTQFYVANEREETPDVYLYGISLQNIPASLKEATEQGFITEMWIPFRAVAEAAGIAVGWDGESRTVSAAFNGHGREIKMDGASAKIAHNLAYVTFDYMWDFLKEFHGSIPFHLGFSDYETLAFENYNFSIEIPSSWEDKYFAVEFNAPENGVRLFHRATDDLLGAGRGLLFTLSRVPGEYTNPNLISADGNVLIITNGGGYCYYLEKRTDEPVYPEPGSEAEAEYNEMKSEYMDVITRFILINE